MLLESYVGKNTYSAGKTSGVFRGGASGAKRGYVVAHCGGGGGDEAATSNFPLKKGEETLEIAKKNIILTPTLTLIFRNLILV